MKKAIKIRFSYEFIMNKKTEILRLTEPMIAEEASEFPNDQPKYIDKEWDPFNQRWIKLCQ